MTNVERVRGFCARTDRLLADARTHKDIPWMAEFIRRQEETAAEERHLLAILEGAAQ